MKKGLIAVVVAAVLAAGGAGGYMVYQKKTEEKAYETKMAATINSLPTIVVYEKQDLPTIEEEFEGTGDVIDLETVEPDISNVYTSEPGEYEVKYAFQDTKGTQRTATVKCEVRPELASHVDGMKDIEIDKGDDLPADSGCTFDEYIDSVTLNTEDVDNTEAGTYDISYTILGADGEMKTVDGFQCVVNEVATPTPTPTPSPTPTPEPETETEAETKAIEAETETESEQESETGEAMGNVEVQKEVVETGDENNILAIVAVIVVCLAAAGGALVYKKKKNK